MDKESLQEYVKQEVRCGKNLAREILARGNDPKSNLRHLYGIPKDTKLIYAESGGISNVDFFPEDITVIMPIFPWSKTDIENAVGSFTRLRVLIESGRVFPVLQHPLYYVNCDHLQFLFDRQTPSYFTRGLFAYSTVLGFEPIIEITENGIPVLHEIHQLMNHCNRTHKEWLKQAKADEATWEYRYRKQSLRDEAFYRRLHSSLCYRYASVALCIGQHNADELLSVFPTSQASSILLHLHMLFDHVMCHGLGSDFVVRPNTPDGVDFYSSKRSGVTRPHELNVADKLDVWLPKEKNEYVRCLLRDEHFLRKVDFSLLSPDSLPTIQDQLARQVTEFRNKVAIVTKGKTLIQHSVQITVYLLSGTALFSGVESLAIGGAAGIISGLKVPWLAEVIAMTLKKIHRNKLASYALNPIVRKNQSSYWENP